MTLLDELWQAPAERVVAFGVEGDLSLADLRSGALQLAARMNGAGAQRWAICLTDSYHFCQALLACALTGHQMILPGHQRPAALAALLAQGAFDGVLADEPADLSCPLLMIDELPTAAPRSFYQPGTGSLAPTITLYTSGSSGDPKPIGKVWQQLDTEVRVQRSLWGQCSHGARLYSSVSHQHIYGLLFRILLPLALGIPLARRQTDYPEQLQSDSGPWLLVSSPAFLSRLDPALQSSGCQLVLSSGGPLAWQDARQCAALLGQRPVEIYGSSETGGIGWRQREQEDQCWHAFPGMQLSSGADQLLTLISPFLPDNTPWLGSDRIALDEGGQQFRLLGRSDRIIKLEEKRISLDDVELRLLSLPWVNEVAVMPLERGGRQVLGVALVPSAEGQAEYDALGHGPFLQALRQMLRPWLEPVALPRSLRMFNTIPLTGAGKRDGVALRHSFACDITLPEGDA